MKLYATIKNERGKAEGVGSNELLTIEINRGNRRMVEFYLTLDRMGNNKELIVVDMLNLSDGSTTRVYEYEINKILPEYKKTKNSGDYCSKCGFLWQDHLPTGGQCPIKGKKQKGEKLCENGYPMPCDICPKDGQGHCTT